MNFVFAPYEKLSIKINSGLDGTVVRPTLCVSGRGYSHSKLAHVQFLLRFDLYGKYIHVALKFCVLWCSSQFGFVRIVASVWHVALVLRPTCFNACFPCQYTQLRNLHLRVLGLTPFRCLRSVTLNPTYPLFRMRISFLIYMFSVYTRFCKNTTRA